MPDEDDAITIVRNDDDARYEVRVGDTLAGFTEFTRDARGRLLFPHTEVDPAFGGRGLATRVVAAAMTDAAAQGATVVPLCPVVVKYVDAHEVPGLVVEWPRSAGRG